MKHDTAIPAGRRVYIDFLKVIAIYLVLFNHTGVSGFVLFTVRQGTKMYFPLMFNAILIKIAVPLFFMCTGALMLDPARRLTGRDIFRRYFLRVLVILLVWAWLYYVYGVVGTYIFTGWLEPDWLLNSVVHTLCFDHHVQPCRHRRRNAVCRRIARHSSERQGACQSKRH